MNTESNPPNILILLTDQQRFDSLGCYNPRISSTPHLDRLAADGVRFDQCYVTNPICTPSRASMFTGKHVQGHGVYQLYDNLPADEVLFTQRLQALGYQTALIGKLHVSSIHEESFRRHPSDGFEVYEPCIEGPLFMEAPFQAYARWLEERDPEFYQRYKEAGRKVGPVPASCHFSTWAAERTEAFLENRDASRPFCAVMSLFDPHNPYDNHPPEASALVDPEELSGPVLADRDTDPDPEDLERQRRSSYLGSFDRLTREAVREMRFGYQAAVAFADQAFGRTLAALDRLGLRENTLVIMCSDHGDMLGDHRLLVKGGFFYDAVARAPLLMRWPARFPRGRVVDGLVSLLDLPATCLEAAGASLEEIDRVMPESKSLLAMAAGRTRSIHEEVVAVFHNSGLSSEPSRTPYWDSPINATMLRHRQWKLTLFHDFLDRNGPVEGMLFDMENDPQETRNLFNDPIHASVRQLLSDRLLNWFLTQQLQFGGRGGSTLSSGVAGGPPPVVTL
jgi:arylsulfatase